MTRSCAIPKCKTGYKSVKQKISTFRVPKNVEVFEKWKAAIPGVELKQSHFVCEKHFQEHHILRKWIKRDSNGRLIAEAPYAYPQLAPLAVPTIFNDNEGKPKLVTDGIAATMAVNVFPTTKCSEFQFISIESPSSSNTVDELSTQVKQEDPLSHDFIRQDAASPHDHEVSLPHKIIKEEVLSPFDRIEYKISQMEDGNVVSTAPAVVHTECTSRDRNLAISNITINFTNSEKNEKFSVIVPKSWTVSEFATDGAQRIVFSRIVFIQENGEQVPVIEKSVTREADKTLIYNVYGRTIAPNKYELTANLEDTKLLLETLQRFKNLNVCSGLGALNFHFLSADVAFQDCVRRLRAKDCTMLSKRKRCDACTKIREQVMQREKRSKKD